VGLFLNHGHLIQKLTMLRKLVLLILAGVFLAAPLAATAEEIRIATWNLEWFFDTDTRGASDIARENATPSAADWEWKKKMVAKAIARMQPTIIALQEVENREVVQELADVLAQTHGLKFDVAFEQGFDTATEQDVAFLVKKGLKFTAKRESFGNLRNKRGYRNVSKHLGLTVTLGDEEAYILTTHLISSSPEKRTEQAMTIRHWIAPRIDKRQSVIVLGDMNASQRFNETTPASELGQIRGFATETRTDDLIDLNILLGGSQRQTHISGRELDRILMSAALTTNDDGVDLVFKGVEQKSSFVIQGRKDRNRRAGVWKIDANERDISDHYPLIAIFDLK